MYLSRCPSLEVLRRFGNPAVKVLKTTTSPEYFSLLNMTSMLRYTTSHSRLEISALDELHTQPNRKLFDVMTKGSGDARMQPLYFLITTAGTQTQSICYETHQKALDILEGRKRDVTFYPVIYGAKEEDDWTDPRVWKKANPPPGITVGIDKVKAACESAKQNPAEENSFRQLRLNQWVKQAVRWMPMAKWDACAFLVDETRLEGRVCYGGLDLSSTTDITAFVLVFPPGGRRQQIRDPAVLLDPGGSHRPARTARPRELRPVGEAGRAFDHGGERGPLRIHRAVH